MTKLEEKKQEIGYRKDGPCCENCEHFTSEKKEVKSEWTSRTWIKEGFLKCTLNGFATKKRTWCKYHQFIGDK